jgi:PHP family Zn ribbon phosphoesterase
MDFPALYKLDLHVHAAERSGCASTYEEDQIRAAMRAGLNGIAFTDHHAMPSPTRLDELNAKYAPFKIYAGIEITAEDDDWLVLGLREKALSRAMPWRYIELADFVREKGGFLALAHPFRYSDQVPHELESCPPDGIEFRSNNTPVTREGEIRSLAARLHLAPLCNSDAHSTRSLGRFFNVMTNLPSDDQELIEALHRLKS